MAWLKGVRTDGFIKIDENVNFRGTVVGTGDGIMRPYGALDYYVDGTDGDDSYSGKSWEGAFATVQKAITTQIADTNAKGDNIWIAPGTYTETVTCSGLTNVNLIGATCGSYADAVIMQSASGSALVVEADESTSSTMTNSSISGITFLTSSAGTRGAPALVVGFMTKSIVDRCKFAGTYDAGKGAAINTTCGLQIGNVTDTNFEYHEHSRISNCEFTSGGIRQWELDVAIRVGAKVTTTPEYKGFKSMIIENNIIAAEVYGIMLNTGAASCGGSVIRNNIITSHQGGGAYRGICSDANDGEDSLCFIIDNRIQAQDDGIVNFGTYLTHGNIVSIGGGTPGAETA